jgi:hypothetical protein
MRTLRRSNQRGSEAQGGAPRGVSLSLCLIVLCVLCSLSVLAAQQQPPPQPFPRPGTAQPARPTDPPPTTTTPARPAIVVGSTEQPPTEEFLGVPVYPGAQFIASYDAGRGQRYYIYGTAASFVELVNYYRTALKQRGELVYEIPATHSFDVGRYREETMAFPPGVTVKDYESDVSKGYPNPKPGGQPARFPTLIQIVPVTER